MPGFKNSSEEYAYKLCRNTFLSLWSYLNPQGKDKGKELCDILVVCDPDVIIINVKEVALKPDKPSETQKERWQRRAIEKSVG